MIDVIIGHVALRSGRYWVGVASGNRYCTRLRRTPERALADAQRLERRKVTDPVEIDE